MSENNIKTQRLKTPLGEILIGDHKGKLCLCIWAKHSKRTAIEHRLQRLSKEKFVEEKTPLLEEAGKQITEFLNHKRTSFNLETELIGTAFQKEVWNALNKIGYGKTVSFRDLAVQIGQEESVRPIAAAISTNPLALIKPCHRITSETKGTGPNYEEKINEKLRSIEN